MQISKAAIPELYEALARTSEAFGNNVCFAAIEDRSGRIARAHVRLTVADSRGPGARLGMPDYETGRQRRIKAACWHVHGTFFDAMWEVAPEATVRAGTVVMRGPADNWQDRNIGSYMSPLMFSEACECRQTRRDARGPTSDNGTGHEIRFATLEGDPYNGPLVETNVRMIRQADIMKCPHVILIPTHYRPDGSCKCDDPEERAMMIREWDYTPADFAQK